MAKLIACIVAVLALLVAHQRAEAQQVCYSYDGLGRLIGVIDPQGQAAIYEYDSVGNILSIRREAASGPVGIVVIDPPGGIPGSQVEILGIGFSSVPGQNQVTLNGVATNVLLASPCRLTIEVPSGATSGLISVTTPFGAAVSSSPFAVFNISVGTTVPLQIIGTSQQFSAAITGCSDPRLVWSVNGIVGGNAAVGTITQTGLYTAPASEPSVHTVVIRATSVGCPGLFAESTILVMGIPNVTIARPATAVVLPAMGGTGGLSANVTIANPPVSAVLPALGDTGGLPLNVTVGQPPVSVVVTGPGGPAGLPQSVTVANPPVTVEFAP